MNSSFRRTLTVTREGGAGSFVKGIWTPAATGTLTIQASVQPPTPDDMRLLPEARRRDAEFLLYTDTQLFPATVATKKNADKVAINGENYEVLGVWNWQNNVINHYKVIVGKLQ